MWVGEWGEGAGRAGVGVNSAGDFPSNYINLIHQSITLSEEFKLQWKWLLTTLDFCIIIAVFRVRRWTVTQCAELVFHISVSLQRTINNYDDYKSLYLKLLRIINS